ncbi:IS607 family transposase [Ktedonospora formicarum]|uniref:IS607 family transposase n=1 Tax=Ktedonospora formicarum TaxID=2778364 RepID=A0A8J3MUW9_9CHLR|nr:IS607 family transposase [Ktedonospora formicarum]
MKLSQYAKQQGVSYTTAWRWYKAGQLDVYQTATGTVIVRDPIQVTGHVGRIALYARVSSAEQKEDVARQLERLRSYAAARGYQVAKEVIEIASGLNDHRPKLLNLLTDTSIGTIILEHRDRLTRFGYHYIEQLLAVQDRHLEVILPTDTQDELVDDFVALITSMAARIYGRRNSKRRAEKIKACVEQVMKEEDV